MDRQMVTLMAHHDTILANQEYVITQLTHQHDCIENLKNAVRENSEIVEEVRQLLAALKGFSTIAKWATVAGGFLAALWHGTKAVISFIGRA